MASTSVLNLSIADPFDLRNELISTERMLKSIGYLFYLKSFILILSVVTVGELHLLRNDFSGTDETFVLAVVALILVSLGALSFALGAGFQRLSPWVKLPAGLMSSLGLLSSLNGSVLGLIIAGISLVVIVTIFSRKGRYVLSNEYRSTIEATPEIESKAHFLIRYLFKFLLFLLALGIIVMVLNLVAGNN